MDLLRLLRRWGRGEYWISLVLAFGNCLLWGVLSLLVWRKVECFPGFGGEIL